MSRSPAHGRAPASTPAASSSTSRASATRCERSPSRSAAPNQTFPRYTPLAHEHAITAEHDQATAPGIYENDKAAERDADQGDQDPHRRPDGHVVSVLGAQPDPGDRRREAWEQAAGAIERYRSRYGIDEPSALGAEPPAGEFEQRRDRRQAAGRVLDALGRLGRPAPDRGPLEERMRNAPGLAYGEPERDRTIG